MAIGNGKTNGTTLPEAVEAHGGHWHNNIDGPTVIKQQLEQLQQLKQAQAIMVQMDAQRQLVVAKLKAEADAAEQAFIAAMASSDYQAAAQACRRMTRAEARLMYVSEWK